MVAKLPDVLSEPVKMLKGLGNTEFGTLAQEAFQEFGDIADYIWKSPKLIKTETEDELAKLEAYFPLKGEREADASAIYLRNLRWMIVSRRLREVFPRHMAAGNFLAVVSLFESYCVRVTKKIEEKFGRLSISPRGRGIDGLFDYMKKAGLKLDEMTLWETTNCALNLRNTLVHVNGILDWTKNSNEVRRIVKARIYLAADARRKRGGAKQISRYRQSS